MECLIDTMMAGFCGGIVASLMIFGSGYYALRRMIQQYELNKDEFKKFLVTKELIDTVKQLRKDFDLIIKTAE